MNLAAINAAADNDISNYDGRNQPGYYTGFGDDFVDFDGQNLDFARAVKAKRIFTFTITNTSTTLDKTVILFPSYFPDTTGGQILLSDGAVGVITGSSTPSTIEHMKAWAMLNPTQVTAMRIVSNNALQLQQTMYLRRKSPFKKLTDDYIPIGAFQSEVNNNDKMVTVNSPFQIDNQTEISLLIPLNTTTSITFFCGAVLNTAAALNNKFRKAAGAAASAQGGAQ